MRTVGSWVAAFGLALLALGLAVQILQFPGFTRGLTERTALADEAGLPIGTMVSVAEQVRAFVVDREGELPATVEGREGFDAAAVSHLDDVADVLAGARIVTGLIAFGLTIWLAFAVARRELSGVADALRRAAVITVVFLALAVLLSTVDFGSFFAAFHSLFFASGTWQFPADALLILVFPETFWAVAGLSWAVLTGLIAGAYWLVGGQLRRVPPTPAAEVPA